MMAQDLEAQRMTPLSRLLAGIVEVPRRCRGQRYHARQPHREPVAVCFWPCAASRVTASRISIVHWPPG